LNIASFFFKPSKQESAPHLAIEEMPIQSSKPEAAALPDVKKASSLDSIFLQMLKANQVNTEGIPTSPFCLGLNLIDEDDKQELSTKQMNYEQIMARLGKKTLKVKIKERREKEKADL